MAEDSPKKRTYFIGFYLCYHAMLRKAKGERLSNDEARLLVNEFCKNNHFTPISDEEWYEIIDFNSTMMNIIE